MDQQQACFFVVVVVGGFFFAVFEYNFLIHFAFINTVYCSFSLSLVIFLNFQSLDSVYHCGSGRMGLWLP